MALNKDLEKRLQEIGFANEDEFIREYTHLVKKIAKRIIKPLSPQIELDDLTQDGFIGLFDAVEKYDPIRDVKFNTYAGWRIEGEILDGLRNRNPQKRRSLEIIKKINKASNELRHEYGREPTREEIAQKLKIHESKINDIWTNREILFSEFSQRRGSLINQEFSEIIVAPEETLSASYHTPFENQLEGLEEADSKKKLEEAIQKYLPQKTREIVKMYLNGITMSDIGIILELTESRISQIYEKAEKTLIRRLSPTFENNSASRQKRKELNPNIQTYTPKKAAKYLELSECQINGVRGRKKLNFVNANGSPITIKSALDIIKNRPSNHRNVKYYKENPPLTKREIKRILFSKA